MPNDSETIERAALLDLHEAADASLAKRLGLRLEKVGPAVASLCAACPTGIVLNRTLGLGLVTPATRDDVREIVSLYRGAGVQRYFIHLHPRAEPAELRLWLAGEGLEPARGWVQFKREADTPPDISTELELREATEADGPAFGAIVGDAFDIPGAAEWLARLPERRDWRIFMSFRNGQPAGTGALFLHQGVAWCDWAATAPAFRRLGSQGALLSRRIREALALGCRNIFTETGEAVEGDAQHSYGNITRMGFEADYLRENFAPPRAT